MLESKNKSRNRVRLAVFFVLSIHVIALMALLMQGCRKPTEEPLPDMNTNPVPPIDTSLFPPETNPPATAPGPDAALSAQPGPGAGMTPSTVTPSQIPAAPEEYTIVKGDTLSSIAKKYSVTVRALQDANPTVEPTRLRIGQKLVIPTAVTSSAAPAAAAMPEMTGGAQVYEVKSGDTLTRIAARFNTTVPAIRAENNLVTDKIRVGQKLRIPPGIAAPAPAEPTAPAPITPAPTPAPLVPSPGA
jgi:LysM repeat protein